MAKKNDELANTNSGSTDLAVPTNLVGGLTIAGSEQQGLKLSELKLYQATPTEQKKYGVHAAGSFIDVLEMSSFGPTVSLCVLGAVMCWTKFIKGQKFPVYTKYSKGEVPAADFIPDPNDNDRPPCREQVQAVVLVRGVPWPFLFRFKSTGLTALGKTIQPLEERRRLTGKPIGMYKIGSIDDKGPGGEDYRRLTATPDGDLPPEMYDLASRIKTEWATVVEQMKRVASANDGGDGSEIPI